MELVIKSIKELLNYHFNIPNFQRGYRWEPDNVEKLLNDIVDFHQNHQDGTFYCLQPVVVKKNLELSKDDNTVYDLLDGQQRLTTLWLILNSNSIKPFWQKLHKNLPKCFDLQFESRDNLLETALKKDSISYDNIDLFYLTQALQSIEKWEGNQIELLNAVEKDIVRVIWYEFDKNKDIEEDAKKQSSSINVFTRLNEGKIGLTDTELIKALLLQSDIYPDNQNEIYGRGFMKEHLFHLATEWDKMEKALQRPDMWSMIVGTDYNPLSHMEFLLTLVANKIQKENDYKITDTYHRLFYIISEYLRVPVNDSSNNTDSVKYKAKYYSQKVDEIWSQVRDAFTILNNWYSSTELYHLVGLYYLLCGSGNIFHKTQELFDTYNAENKTKKEFKNDLKSAIGKAIKITEKNTDDNIDGEILKLKELSYDMGHQSRMIKILEAFNVYLHLVERGIYTKFSFSKFKNNKVTSLEHIHPQHLDFEKAKITDVQQWLEAQKEHRAEFNEQTLSDLNTLEKFLQDEKNYKNHVEDCRNIVDKVESFLDKEAGIDDGHMHTLYNMALIDKDTNAALSNKLMDAKRKTLIDRENNNGIYVPIGTNFVFNKHFTKDVTSMKFWMLNDRNAYFKKIEEAYNYFIK